MVLVPRGRYWRRQITGDGRIGQDLQAHTFSLNGWTRERWVGWRRWDNQLLRLLQILWVQSRERIWGEGGGTFVAGHGFEMKI